MIPLPQLAEIPTLDPHILPKHIAIIMDGNRRWAKKQGVPTFMGHWKGAEALTQIVEAASALGIKVVTVYAFSTENWKRSKSEVDALMRLFKLYLSEKKEQMIQKGVKLGAIGNIEGLPPQLRKVLEETKAATAGGSKIELILAINYGARDDIRRAALTLVDKISSGKMKREELTEAEISRHLDTAPWGDPELLIRTSGERRISNFLLWQISYAEIYVTDVLWPDFDEKELHNALLDYQRRQKRGGE